MAPIRKNRISPASPRWRSSKCSLMTCEALSAAIPATSGKYWPGSTINNVQHATHISRAVAALLIFNTLSKAMHI